MYMDQSIKRYAKQYPIGPALNIDIKMDNGSVSFKWTDPKNPIVDKIYFSKWEFTVIIKKEGSAPTNRFDGETILETYEYNKYKDGWFTDTNIEIGKTYFYAIIPCSDLGKHSWDKLDIIEITPVLYDTIFENNSWDTICTMVDNGCADKVWTYGDTKSLTLGGNINKTINVFISDILKTTKEEYLKSPVKIFPFRRQMLCIGSKELLSGYSYNDIENALPTEILNNITNKNSHITSILSIDIETDPIYTDNESRIKYLDGVPTAYSADIDNYYVNENGEIVRDSLPENINNVKTINIML